MPTRLGSVYFVFTAGLALFSMFFGSGNLIFPLEVGIQAGGYYGSAFFGLFLTAIIVPALGLLSVVKTSQDGSTRTFFEGLSPRLAPWLILSMLCLMGPFGVGARCLLVGVGGVKLLAPLGVASEPWFVFLLNSGFCLLVYGLLTRRADICETLGKYLTPWLIGAIGFLILAGLSSDKAQNFLTPEGTAWSHLWMGITEGYQTMDLLAAFFFSATAFDYIKKSLPSGAPKKDQYKAMEKASLIGFGFLTLTYGGLVGIGARYGAVLKNISPDERLPFLADLILGQTSGVVVSGMIFLACLTTLCVLTELTASFFLKDLFPRLGLPTFSKSFHIALVLLITYVVSSFGFYQVAHLIKVSLSYLYPALIVFSIARLIHGRVARQAFWLALVGTFIFHLLESL